MSGGYFDHQQYRLGQMADEIEEVIATNSGNDVGFNSFSEETLNEFRHAIALLKKAQVYVHEIDWLLSGDTGEERFHERLINSLEKLKCTP